MKKKAFRTQCFYRPALTRCDVAPWKKLCALVPCIASHVFVDFVERKERDTSHIIFVEREEQYRGESCEV